MESSINQIKKKTQLKSSPIDWIKLKKEYQGLKVKYMYFNIFYLKK
jgi:hypothetical protein